jgi:hypothetical protein
MSSFVFAIGLFILYNDVKRKIVSLSEIWSIWYDFVSLALVVSSSAQIVFELPASLKLRRTRRIINILRLVLQSLGDGGSSDVIRSEVGPS